MIESNDDKPNAEILLQDFAKENVVIFESVRIGNLNKKGKSALKITLPNSNITSKIINSNKDVLREGKVYVSADLTISQRSQK